jgi:adenylate kinase
LHAASPLIAGCENSAFIGFAYGDKVLNISKIQGKIMPSIAIVAGAPGSGKSTLLKGIKGYKVVNLGDMMIKHAISKGYTNDRDKLRALSTKKIGLLKRLTFSEINAMKGNIIIDTHASVEHKGRFVPGLPRNEIALLKGSPIKALIYVDAPTGEVLKRRKADASREREIEPAWVIDTQRTISIASLAMYSSDLNIPMYIIVNRQGAVDESTALLESYLKEAFGRS